jgi:microsomal dipeptidase-like Zn-dependent dipeptidase
VPCSLVEIDRRFRDDYCLHHQGDCPRLGQWIAPIMKAVNTSKTSVNFYQTTRHIISENSQLHTRRRENLIPHLNNVPLKRLYKLTECTYIQSLQKINTSCSNSLFSEHISYIRDLIGVEHIGVGGDFDGINR